MKNRGLRRGMLPKNHTIVLDLLEVAHAYIEMGVFPKK